MYTRIKGLSCSIRFSKTRLMTLKYFCFRPGQKAISHLTVQHWVKSIRPAKGYIINHHTRAVRWSHNSYKKKKVNIEAEIRTLILRQEMLKCLQS